MRQQFFWKRFSYMHINIENPFGIILPYDLKKNTLLFKIENFSQYFSRNAILFFLKTNTVTEQTRYNLNIEKLHEYHDLTYILIFQLVKIFLQKIKNLR